jgi:hypothetical protein
MFMWIDIDQHTDSNVHVYLTQTVSHMLIISYNFETTAKQGSTDSSYSLGALLPVIVALSNEPLILLKAMTSGTDQGRSENLVVLISKENLSSSVFAPSENKRTTNLKFGIYLDQLAHYSCYRAVAN